jgi:hypothetical protein
VPIAARMVVAVVPTYNPDIPSLCAMLAKPWKVLEKEGGLPFRSPVVYKPSLPTAPASPCARILTKSSGLHIDEPRAPVTIPTDILARIPMSPESSPYMSCLVAG